MLEGEEEVSPSSGGMERDDRGWVGEYSGGRCGWGATNVEGEESSPPLGRIVPMALRPEREAVLSLRVG